jgi:hypothetical protein
MSFKYLASKEKVNEFFNPVLDGSYISGPNGQISQFTGVQAPDYTSQFTNCSDMIDKPFWLDNDDETIVMNGDITSIGTYFINGLPLSSWSAQRGGSYTGAYKKVLTQNWYYVNALAKHLFPNGIKAYLDKDKEKNYEIEDLSIIRMTPTNVGIGFHIYIKFSLNENEIWGKFENVGIDLKPKFICEEIQTLSVEDKIKITGKIWNIILGWFKVQPGIYQCLMKDVLVFTELGQLKNITEGSIIEVIHSDEDKIKINFEQNTYIIKKPTYYWFNWYFEKK